MTISDKRRSLINVYDPNKDNPTFYLNVFKSVTDIENDVFIICKDCSLTLNPDLDCFNYKHINNPKAWEFRTNVISERKLFNTFRELYPSQRRYT